MRSTARRTKQISRYRHQRVTVEPDVPSQHEGDLDRAEKLEVHVHVHRGAGAEPEPERPTIPARAELTGTLFDWKTHYDRVCVKPTGQKVAGLARLTTCRGCYQPMSIFAGRCARCATLRWRRRLAPVLAAGLFLIALAGLFGALRTGTSGTLSSFANFGHASDEDAYDIVEAPVAPSVTGTAAAALPRELASSSAPTSIR